MSTKDMLEKHALNYYKAGKALACLRLMCETIEKKLPIGHLTFDWSTDRKASFRDVMDDLSSSCEAINLTIACGQIDRVRELVYGASIENVTWDKIERELFCLERMIAEELESRYFLFLDDSHVQYYLENQFDQALVRNFPSAQFDMEEAGKCFSCRRYTASAFHLIRVAEYGLGSIRHTYGIEECESWGKLLAKVRDYALDCGDKKRERKIMSLHARIRAIKDAWRDDTMHVVRTYTEEQTRELVAAVRNFLGNIKDGLP